MRSALLLFLPLLVAASGSAQAASGNSKTSTGSAAAIALAPLKLVHWTGVQLNFGTISVASAGTVTINATSGAAAVSGGVTFAPGSTTSMDYFTASGEPGRQISITTGGGTVTTGVGTMTFTTTPMLATGFLPSGGAGYFTVGGKLNVAANQIGGTYTGSYAVTVAYN